MAFGGRRSIREGSDVDPILAELALHYNITWYAQVGADLGTTPTMDMVLGSEVAIFATKVATALAFGTDCASSSDRRL